MPLRRPVLLLTVLLSVFGAASRWPAEVAASDGFQAVLPDELKMTADPLAPVAY
jgi:hypothetical protein